MSKTLDEHPQSWHNMGGNEGKSITLCFHCSLCLGHPAGGDLMKRGDVVRNTYEHPVLQPVELPLGVVLEPPKKGDKYPQVLVYAGNTRHWWHMAVVEVVSESR